MTHVILVGFGGFIGSIVRYLFGFIITTSFKIPLSTLSVNLLGSFFIGLVLSLLSSKTNSNIYCFLVPGLLGGFTTYSTFSSEVLNLYLKQQYSSVMICIFLSLIGGLILTYLGHCLGRSL